MKAPLERCSRCWINIRMRSDRLHELTIHKEKMYGKKTKKDVFRSMVSQQQVPWKLNWEPEDWPEEHPQFIRCMGKRRRRDIFRSVVSGRGCSLQRQVPWKLNWETEDSGIGGSSAEISSRQFSAREPLESITIFYQMFQVTCFLHNEFDIMMQ